MDFDTWKQRVDGHIRAILHGMDSDCIPDWRYNQAFKEGMSPKQAALKAIKYGMEC